MSEARVAQEQRDGIDDVRRYRAALQGFVESNPAIEIRRAVEEYSEAVESERAARSAVDIAPMREVWRATRELLRDSEAESCPSCFRAFDSKTTRASVLEQIDASLAQLESVEKAEDRRKAVAIKLVSGVRALDNSLRSVPPAPVALHADSRTFASAHSELRSDVEAWLASATGGQPSTLPFEGSIASLREAGVAVMASCDRVIEEVTKRAVIPFEEIDREIKRLIEIRDDWARLVRQETELSRVLEQFRAAAEVIRTRIHQHLTKVLGDLQDDVRAIYSMLRKNDEDVPVISVRVEEKSMSVVLELFGEKEMVPSSYLSDSQLNSLGLALYFASIRRFNRSFPFVLLDDVMSSYDAGHRLNLIEVVREFLADFQIVLTTHDEPFYRQIRSMLNGKNGWKFYRLLPYKFDVGLRFRHERETAEELKRRIDEGERAEVLAQIVMSDFEAWLLAICADRNAGVKLPIRRDLTPADPTISTLWSAAQACFTDFDRQHPSYAFVAGHALLNWPRHATTGAAMNVTPAEIQSFFDHLERFRTHYESRRPPTSN